MKATPRRGGLCLLGVPGGAVLPQPQRPARVAKPCRSSPPLAVLRCDGHDVSGNASLSPDGDREFLRRQHPDQRLLCSLDVVTLIPAPRPFACADGQAARCGRAPENELGPAPVQLSRELTPAWGEPRKVRTSRNGPAAPGWCLRVPTMFVRLRASPTPLPRYGGGPARGHRFRSPLISPKASSLTSPGGLVVWGRR